MIFAAHVVLIKTNLFFHYYLHTVILSLCTWKDNTALRCQFFGITVLMNGMRQYILKLYWSFLFFCFEYFTTNQL